MSNYILVINPGSTSTKIGVFENDTLLFDKTLRHPAEEIAKFATIPDQKSWRKELVEQALAENNFDMKKLTAICARGGLVKPIRGGTYATSDALLADCVAGVQGQHACNLGGLIAREIGDELGITIDKALATNPDLKKAYETEEDVKASYESGVLHVKFPKQEALKAPEKKTILIEG